MTDQTSKSVCVLVMYIRFHWTVWCFSIVTLALTNIYPLHFTVGLFFTLNVSDIRPMCINFFTRWLKKFMIFWETIPSTIGTMRLRKRKLGCLEGSRDMQQPVKRCRVANRHVVDLQRIHSEDEKKNEKKTISFDDAPIPSKTVKGLRGKRKRSQTPWKKQVIRSLYWNYSS